MSIDRVLSLKLLVDTNEISKKMGEVTSPSGPLANVGNLVKGWGIAMAADVAISIGAGIVDGIKGGFEDARLAEAVETQLANTFENLDLGTMQELDSIMESIGSRALDLGFDDTASLQAFDEFLRLTHDTDEALKLLAATQDLARASGDDLATSATTVSGAYRGQSRALAQFGVEGVEGIEAVDAAWATFAGSADEHMTTADGRMERFQGRIDEIFEGIASVVLGLSDPFLDVMDALDPVLVSISEGIGPAFEDLQTFIGPIVTSFGDLATKAVELWDKLEPVRVLLEEGLKVAIENLGTIITATFDTVTGIIDAFILLLDGDLSGAFGKLLGVVTTIFNAMVDVVKKPFNLILGAIEGALNFIGDSFFDALEAIRSNLNGVAFIGDHIPDEAITWGGISVPRLASGGIVTDPTLAVIGEAGPEAVVPLDGRHGIGGGNTYNITVHAVAASPADVGKKVVEVIEAYERRAGSRWRTA